MEHVRLAWKSLVAAHRFLFWTVVAWATATIHWNKEANRELLILNPRRPKDLYDEGYVLFAYDLTWDGWRGYWRTPQHVSGMAPAEVFEIVETQWGGVPFHQVEFSDMPHISFKVRAVSLEWCRANCRRPAEQEVPEAAVMQPPMSQAVH